MAPFECRDRDKAETYRLICETEVKFPYESVGSGPRDLISKLLMKDPTDRIELKDVENHFWILAMTAGQAAEP